MQLGVVEHGLQHGETDNVGVNLCHQHLTAAVQRAGDLAARPGAVPGAGGNGCQPLSVGIGRRPELRIHRASRSLVVSATLLRRYSSSARSGGTSG
ncbi:hypothetical protein GCM10027202_31240 [Microvirgula curvata]